MAPGIRPTKVTLALAFGERLVMAASGVEAAFGFFGPPGGGVAFASGGRSDSFGLFERLLRTLERLASPFELSRRLLRFPGRSHRFEFLSSRRLLCVAQGLRRFGSPRFQFRVDFQLLPTGFPSIPPTRINASGFYFWPDDSLRSGD